MISANLEVIWAMSVYMVLSKSQGIMFMNVQTGEPIIAPSSTDHPLYEQIVEACRTVHDPEIPVNIYDLGLIYRISIDGESNVEIDMTLTAPGCPVAGEMPGWVADAVEPLPGVKTVNVELVWDSSLGHGDAVRRGAAGTGLHLTPWP